MGSTSKELTDARRMMRQLYKDVWAFTIPRKDDVRVRRSKSSSLYGEITFGSIQKMLEHLKLTNKDVFFDLGSGAGKVILQVAMTTAVKKAIGIELSKTRFDIAVDVLSRAKELGALKGNRCEFWNDDILKADLSKATVIYTCSTAFPQSFMDALTKKFSKLKKGIRIVSIQDLPDHPHIHLTDTLKLDMTWARKLSVYVYQLQ